MIVQTMSYFSVLTQIFTNGRMPLQYCSEYETKFYALFIDDLTFTSVSRSQIHVLLTVLKNSGVSSAACQISPT